MQVTTKTSQTKKIYTIAISVLGAVVVGLGIVQSDFWQSIAGTWMIIAAVNI